MAKKSGLQLTTVRLAHIHFFYIFAFVASIIVYDASLLIAPDAVLRRWKMAVAMAIVVTGVWYFARIKKDSPLFQKWLIALLVFMDIIFASFLVYADRGMASLAVALYGVPIIVAGTLSSRSAVLATASLCTASYAFVAVKYFVDYFNEGYKVQLYGTIGFYGAVFFILALLLVTVIRRKEN